MCNLKEKQIIKALKLSEENAHEVICWTGMVCSFRSNNFCCTVSVPVVECFCISSSQYLFLKKNKYESNSNCAMYVSYKITLDFLYLS